jgi:hypothetical protein
LNDYPTDKPITKRRRRVTKRRHPTDEELAPEYLAGKFKKRRGQVSHKFHKPGSRAEAESRAALIRLLRAYQQPLSPMLRSRLAALLDQDHPYEERMFVIENRRSGPQPRHALMIEVARFIAIEIAKGQPMKSTKEKAGQCYGVSARTVDRAWAEHGNSELIGPIWKAGRTIN